MNHHSMIKLHTIAGIEGEEGTEIEVPPSTKARAIDRLRYVDNQEVMYITEEQEVQRIPPFSLIEIETGFEDVGKKSIMLVVPKPTKFFAGALMAMCM